MESGVGDILLRRRSTVLGISQGMEAPLLFPRPAAREEEEYILPSQGSRLARCARSGWELPRDRQDACPTGQACWEALRAWSMSALMSSKSSMPTESRT